MVRPELVGVFLHTYIDDVFKINRLVYVIVLLNSNNMTTNTVTFSSTDILLPSALKVAIVISTYTPHKTLVMPTS